MYICFEWVVGTWKTTQSKRLAVYLQNLYPDKQVVWIREPGGTQIAEAIRKLVQWTVFDEEMDPLTDAYLYASARAQLLQTKVAPVLANDWIIVSDRNFCTSLAYQGFAQWLGQDRVREINKEAVGGLIPDIHLFMEMPIEEGLKRIFDHDGDKRERKKKEFFERAYHWYKNLALFHVTRSSWSPIDATGDEDIVFERIRDRLWLFLEKI